MGGKTVLTPRPWRKVPQRYKHKLKEKGPKNKPAADQPHFNRGLTLPSTLTYVPTNFTSLTHHARHILTLGLGTAKSKAVAFVFDSESTKAAVDRLWPRVIPLGDVNRKLIRGLAGCEMSRFKFRKGCLTFYVYAVRRHGWPDFSCADNLRTILEAVVALKDFLDHTAMLALPSRRSITLLVDQVAVTH
ncbi:hypothetical protein BHE74_00015238 [Ensete ventricosum]|nr:hypothetical protein GW17_00033532 [Ensete ventricosum]RWW76661.1 hypothetical protein BHE74_00015238 [Ensete ventricosum]RZR87003.1 hypothetical protein BHM03_00014288 [Ensete ventricosum]